MARGFARGSEFPSNPAQLISHVRAVYLWLAVSLTVPCGSLAEEPNPAIDESRLEFGGQLLSPANFRKMQIRRGDSEELVISQTRKEPGEMPLRGTLA